MVALNGPISDVTTDLASVIAPIGLLTCRLDLGHEDRAHAHAPAAGRGGDAVVESADAGEEIHDRNRPLGPLKSLLDVRRRVGATLSGFVA
jgi:hypothetical protein